jgi:FAD dependent oxidoreductase TIGR03364
MHRCDVAVVGGGILGLAHAITAARRGMSVALFERGIRARGASVRNFGMIWPIGIPRGPLLERALVSRARWIEFSKEAKFWLEESGSLHVAYHDDEMQVLREFHERESKARSRLRVLDAGEVLRANPSVRPEGLQGGLRCDDELRVDPREAIASLTGWLAAQENGDVRMETAVRHIAHPIVTTGDGTRWQADHVIVCGGDDFATLYPETFASCELTRCKLQMMRTPPQPVDWRLGPTLAAGLTLCHYDSFSECPTQGPLRERLESEFPRHFEHGIHVLAAQNGLGEVVIGDSHEYGMEFDPVERAEIEELILDYLATMLDLPDATIAQRWHGTYAKRTSGHGAFIVQPEDGVTIVSCGGGTGMTMSFGLAEDVLDGIEHGSTRDTSITGQGG